MPDPVAHYLFSRQVVSELPEDIQNVIDLAVFGRALHGPDPWSTIGFYGGKNKKYAVRSRAMHKTHTGRFLMALAIQAKENPETPVFSVLAGTICHYCLDRTAHPYITCKGGEYDGTAKTRSQIGGHVRLERGIDSYFIRKKFGVAPWHFSIPSKILTLKQYPESLREPLDKAFRQAYGWENVFDQINASLRDERLFYGLMQDPFGLVQLLLRPISMGETNYCVYSFFHQEIDSHEIDFLNLRHSPWHHPFKPEMESNDSFLDIYDKARMDAIQLIRGVYDWIYRGKTVHLEALLGNCSYSTGFDCDDPCNRNKPVCEPLAFGKVFNL